MGGGVKSAAGSGNDPAARLAAELRAVRERSGKTLRELERLTNASDSALSRYLSGRTVPPWSVIESLCRVAGHDSRRLRSVWAAAGEGRGGVAAPRRRNYLPRGAFAFVGRTAQTEALLAAGDVAAIDGMAGVGKTALAIQTAHALEAVYPDGQFYIDLHGYTSGCGPLDPAVALHTLLRALDVPVSGIPEDTESRAALWRAELARRRVVVVLDNAASTEQAQPLLPGAPGSKVLLTSRRRLARLGGVPSISLDVLSPAEAAELFARTVGRERIRAESAADDNVTEIVRSCGYLPLGVCLAAARMHHRPAWTVGYLAGRLSDKGTLLGELDLGDGGVAASLDLSMRDLDEDTSRMFRLLGFTPGHDIDVCLAAALADRSLDEAEKLLEALLDIHLVEQHAVGRYRLHNLARKYACHLLAERPRGERSAAWLRLRAHDEQRAARSILCRG